MRISFPTCLMYSFVLSVLSFSPCGALFVHPVLSRLHSSIFVEIFISILTTQADRCPVHLHLPLVIDNDHCGQRISDMNDTCSRSVSIDNLHSAHLAKLRSSQRLGSKVDKIKPLDTIHSVRQQCIICI